jgi:hypothetical protein
MKNRWPALLILLAISPHVFGQTSEQGAAKGHEGVWQGTLEEGRTFTGDPKDNKNYRCYGAEALAVADAVVDAVIDGIPENVLGLNSRAAPITLETVGGNYVTLDLGQGRKGWGWKASEAKATTEKRQMEIPLENDVVRFPDTQ